MKRIFILAILAAASFAHAQDISGDWQGTLRAGASELRLVLHITRAADGTLKSTLDSIDQGANGIRVTSTTFKDSKLNLDVTDVHGTYEGKVSPDGKTIAGTWIQGQALPLEFTRAEKAAALKPAKPSDIDGAWMGSIDTGAIKLRVVFHITNTADGLTATLDSPDQGVQGIPTTSVTRTGASLKIEVPKVSGSYEGTIAADLSSIDGKWTQGGGVMPLVLKPLKDQTELAPPKRPQNPTRPYPYREEEITYDNKVENVTLAATFTIPQGKGPFPAVLLITGSGPQDRDESLLGHKPFLVLSDYLTRHGIAVLRADDRGVGKSTGIFAKATTADFATDVEAGVAYLKTHREVDPHKIGLIGHSEGGVIAPMVAARNQDVAFIVMMAGTGVPGDQILPAQGEAIEVASGKSPAEAAKNATREKEILALIESEKDEAVLDKELKEKMKDDTPEAQIGAKIAQLTSPWFRYFLTYDPATALRKVTCPVLDINGSLDKQVLPAQNLPAIRKALEESGNRHFEVDELPGLNHLFQTAKTGSPMEYAQIEETMSPAALEKISTWILKQ
ncbi:MAG TPA: alpha/beta fold hydrolase [Candidatus Solibacter sp.]|nr:alpha/beta fold hydrolase [Candidatus Solibacter sp.]